MTANKKKNSATKNDFLAKINGQLEELLDRVDTERQGLEKRVKKTDFYKKATRYQKDLTKQVQTARKDLNKQIQTARSTAYKGLGLATQSDIDKLNRKINALKKELAA